MKQVIARIDTRTGKLLELRTEGFSGTSCLEATAGIRKALGITAEPTPTPAMYVQEDNAQKLEES